MGAVTIILKEYNPVYKEWYVIEKKALSAGIGPRWIKRMNHIGSTAVERMFAIGKQACKREQTGLFTLLTFISREIRVVPGFPLWKKPV